VASPLDHGGDGLAVIQAGVQATATAGSRLALLRCDPVRARPAVPPDSRDLPGHRQARRAAGQGELVAEARSSASLSIRSRSVTDPVWGECVNSHPFCMAGPGAYQFVWAALER
jgi:hypothetical protein